MREGHQTPERDTEHKRGTLHNGEVYRKNGKFSLLKYFRGCGEP